MSKSEYGYKCPACGKAATSVVKTASLGCCVVRSRKCLFCGHTHETGEFPMDVGTALLEAANVLAESAVAKTMGASAR